MRGAFGAPPPNSGPDFGPALGAQVRRVAGGTLRVLVGGPLLVVSVVAASAAAAVNDVARVIEGGSRRKS